MKIQNKYPRIYKIKSLRKTSGLIFLILAILGLLSGQASAYTPNSFTPSECVGRTNPKTGANIPDGTLCELPYFVVQGGDAVDGATFDLSGFGDTTQACDNPTYQNSLSGWNNDNNNDGGWFGAAVQGSTTTIDAAWDIVSDLNSDNPLSLSNVNGSLVNGNLVPNANNYDYHSTNYPNGLNSANYPPASTLDQSPYYLGIANENQDYWHGGAKFGPGVYPYPVTQAPPYVGVYSGHNSKPFNLAPQFYGGDYFSIPCIPNTFGSTVTETNVQTLPTTTQTMPGGIDLTTVDLSSLQSGVYAWPSSSAGNMGNTSTLFINDSGSIPAGRNITLDIYGNAYIESNITYGQYKLSTTPQVNINVAGASDIGQSQLYVQDTVNEIHGFYTVQQTMLQKLSADGTLDGRFNDCAYIDSNGNVQENSDYDAYTDTPQISDINGTPVDCNKQLTVYGSVEADYYDLERSFGDLNTADNAIIPGSSMSYQDPLTQQVTNASNAAEVFRYSPELWIPDGNNTATSCSPTCTTGVWDSVTSLPPVL